ncbi:MAG: hypothetical protein VXV96_14685 [Bdellovibrionota bacterium]|nr:hypothetical protein [Bdellovibrionota bacterium]
MTMQRICGNCGNKTFSFQDIQGQSFPYKSFPNVILQDSFMAYFCSSCGNVGLRSGQAKDLDLLLEASIKSQSSIYVNRIVSKYDYTQAEISDYIGFTNVYLSELKNQKRAPEFKTFNYLKVLSECQGALEMVLNSDHRACYYKHNYKFSREQRAKWKGIKYLPNENEDIEDPMAA